MENIRCNELLPEDTTKLNEAKNRIVGYWNSLSYMEDSGGTTWDVLDEFRTRVTELLDRGQPDDIRRAERLTAQAESLRQGGPD